MDLEWRCTFNFSSLPSGVLQDAYLSEVYSFLKQFEGKVFDNNHDFDRHLSGWKGYLSRQQLDPQLPGPSYDVRINKVYISNATYGHCSFGGLFYLGKEERSSL